MCACVRRLHDVGHSGWWSLVALVPGANLLFGLYALFAPGQEHDNDCGPSPSPAHVASTPRNLTSRAQAQQPALMPVIVNAEVITQPAPAPEAFGVEPTEEFWAHALHECESATMKAGLWAKAYAEAGADERVAKATYIRLRATQLQEQYVEQQQAQKLILEEELLVEQERQRAQDAEIAELLAKMDEAKRAEALLPKGRCPACDAVIPLSSEKCPECTALFSEDSMWKVKPLSKYEALAQKTVEDAVLYETLTKDDDALDSARQLIYVVAILIISVLVIVNS